MSDEVLARNIDRIFVALDLNGDGILEWADFETKTSRIGREFGLTEDAPEVRDFLTAYRRLWEYVHGAADVDRDAVVTKEEFEAAHMARRLSAETVVDLWMAASDRCFDVVDRNGDGSIDQAELIALYRSADVPDPEQTALVAFAGMDADSDGRIDKAEFNANVRGLLTATDDSVKGAHMLGD
ncbi:EF-hand domain-containing protein [Saccharothrix stipae]